MSVKVSFKKTVLKNSAQLYFQTEGYLVDGFTKAEFSGKSNQTLLIHSLEGKILHVGVGFTSEVSNQKYRAFPTSSFTYSQLFLL